MKTKTARWMQTLPICLVLISLLSALASPSGAMAAALGGTVSGKVVTWDAQPLPPGTKVRLFDPGTDNLRGEAGPDGLGNFAIGPLPNGLYAIKAVPPAAGAYTQSLIQAVSVFNASVNAGTLTLTQPQVTGTVFAPDGVTPVQSVVTVSSGGGALLERVDTAPNGTYQVGGLPAGSYAFQAEPAQDGPYWSSTKASLSIPGDTARNLTLRPAQLFGSARDSLNNPVPDAVILVTALDGTPLRRTQALKSGYWAIGELKDGSYKLSLLPPPAHHDLVPPAPLPFSLPGVSNPVGLAFVASPKFVHGVVTTNTNLPVLNAEVAARRADGNGEASTSTDASGAYSLQLTPGLWAISVLNGDSTSPSNWVYPSGPQFVFFSHDTLPDTKTEDFTVVTADAQVKGKVVLPDGISPAADVVVQLYTQEGLGRKLKTGADGSFDIAVPNGGYKLALKPADTYLGPLIPPFVVAPNGIMNLGTLTLIARDALIGGTITSGGSPVSGVPVAAWQDGSPLILRTTSDASGQYRLAVGAGAWTVRPALGPDLPYLFTGEPQIVSLSAGGSQLGLDFSLLSAEASLNGSLVDGSGVVQAEASGWISAVSQGNPALHNGAPIVDGQFTLYLPSGQTYDLKVQMAPGSPDLSSRPAPLTLEPGETSISIPVKAKNATISGSLWDPRSKVVVNQVKGIARAQMDDNFAMSPLNANNGTYSLGVADGLWSLNYWIDPRSDYIKMFGPRIVPVQANKNVIVPLQILQKDAAIGGTVQDPNGAALPGAIVLVRGAGPEVKDQQFNAVSAADGSFLIHLPYGVYRLTAVKNDQPWIQPAEIGLAVARNETSAGHVLKFRLSNATLSGTLTLQNGAGLNGKAYVHAYTADGSLVQSQVAITNGSGAYSLAVYSGEEWRVGAAFETRDAYWSGQGTATVSAGSATLDLTLEGPQAKPAPVSATFDPSQAQSLSLADGADVFIPAGAIPAGGPLTLRIVPIVNRPSHYGADVLRFGYAFILTDGAGLPVEENFLQDVQISFSYTDEELARKGTNESFIHPAYFSTTENRWSRPDSYTVDYAAKRVTLQIDHFTDFALTSQPALQVYLPAVAR